VRNDHSKWTRHCSLVLLAIIGLAGAVSGCDIPPLAAPSAVPVPTYTPDVVVHTATPSPTVAPTATPRPTRTPRPPTATATLSPSPTVTPATPPEATHTPSISPTPTESPYQVEAWVFDPSPVAGSDQFVYARLTYQGQGVAKAWMYVVCHYRALNVRYPKSGFAETDENGQGVVSFNTVQATPGETVLVDVYVRYGGREYRAQTSFKPE